MRCPDHKHLDWHQYVHHEVDDPAEYQRALAQCPDCLELFKQEVEKGLLTPPADFTRRVMAGLPRRETGYSPLRQLLHYAVAASMTLMLLKLGFFDYMLRLSMATASPDYVGRFIEQLFQLLEHLKI